MHSNEDLETLGAAPAGQQEAQCSTVAGLLPALLGSSSTAISKEPHLLNDEAQAANSVQLRLPCEVLELLKVA